MWILDCDKLWALCKKAPLYRPQAQEDQEGCRVLVTPTGLLCMSSTWKRWFAHTRRGLRAFSVLDSAFPNLPECAKLFRTSTVTSDLGQSPKYSQKQKLGPFHNCKLQPAQCKASFLLVVAKGGPEGHVLAEVWHVAALLRDKTGQHVRTV